MSKVGEFIFDLKIPCTKCIMMKLSSARYIYVSLVKIWKYVEF